VVAGLALVPADLPDLEAVARALVVLPVVGQKVALKPALAAVIVVGPKVVLRDVPKVEIGDVPKVDLAVAVTVVLTVVLLKVARAAVTADRIAGLRVIVVARKTKRFSVR